MSAPVQPFVTPAGTRILLALLAEYEATGRATVPAVAARAGRSRSVTHGQLVGLRRLGLVEWREGAYGTLRPRVRVVSP